MSVLEKLTSAETIALEDKFGALVIIHYQWFYVKEKECMCGM